MSDPCGVFERVTYVLESIFQPGIDVDSFRESTKDSKDEEEIEKGEEEIFGDEGHLDFALRGHTLQIGKP